METVPSPFKPTDGFQDCYLRSSSEQRSFVVEVRNLQKWFPEEHENLNKTVDTVQIIREELVYDKLLDIDVVEKPLKHG
jgi:hypothetical protein